MIEPTESCIVIDLETNSTAGNIENTILKFFGYYSYVTNETKIITGNNLEQIEKIKLLFEEHSVIVGFNIKNFDLKVLEKYGIYTSGHNILDLWEIIAPRTIKKNNSGMGGKGRHVLLKINPKDYKLSTLAKELKLPSNKQDNFNYRLLDKTEFSLEDLKYIFSYLRTDVQVTKELFEYMYDYFYCFREVLSKKDIDNWSWFKSSSGSFAYKAICNLANLPEEYSDERKKRENFEGGLVSDPTVEKITGNIYCVDYKSAYPYAFLQHNLYSHSCSCCKPEEKWNGKGIFKLKGNYCSKQQGKIEKVIRYLFNQKDKYKKLGDEKRSYAYKIAVNSAYGISSSPSFKSVFNLNTAADCTYICRESLKYARKTLEEEGYFLLYGDSDSIYFFDKFNNYEKIKIIVQKIIDNLKSMSLFPQTDYEMEIEPKINGMFFFKTGGEFLKKNYIYVRDNKLTIKGLPLKKADASSLGLLIFKKYLEKEIIKKLDCKFDKGYIDQLIRFEIEKDINIIGRTFKIRSSKEYKTDTGLQVNIAKYFEDLFERGEIPEVPMSVLLIPNKRIGIGKGIKYCTIEEAQKHKLGLNELILNKTYSELQYFIKETQQVL